MTTSSCHRPSRSHTLNLYTEPVLLSFLQTEIKDSKPKVQAVKKLIQELPKPNQDTMKVLFSHLLRYIGNTAEDHVLSWTRPSV